MFFMFEAVVTNEHDRKIMIVLLNAQDSNQNASASEKKLSCLPCNNCSNNDSMTWSKICSNSNCLQKNYCKMMFTDMVSSFTLSPILL